MQVAKQKVSPGYSPADDNAGSLTPRGITRVPPDDAPGGDPVVARAGEGERFEQRDNRAVTVRFELPQLSLVEIDFEGSFSVDPHTHDDHVDSFSSPTVPSSSCAATTPSRSAPASSSAAPLGTRHGFRSANGERARVLNLHAPDAGFAAWIRDAAS